MGKIISNSMRWLDKINAMFCKTRLKSTGFQNRECLYYYILEKCNYNFQYIHTRKKFNNKLSTSRSILQRWLFYARLPIWYYILLAWPFTWTGLYEAARKIIWRFFGLCFWSYVRITQDVQVNNLSSNFIRWL